MQFNNLTNETLNINLLTMILKECANAKKRLPEMTQLSVTTASLKNVPQSENTDSGAVMYIISVLLFYSAGIIIMIIKYLRTEKKELQEEAELENFFKEMPTGHSTRESEVNKVAIQAFHALTSLPAGYVSEEETFDIVLETDV